MRRYNRWAGNPKGRLENAAKCAAVVWPGSGYASYQCSRKRGQGKGGLLCHQHAKIKAAGRRIDIPEDDAK